MDLQVDAIVGACGDEISSPKNKENCVDEWVLEPLVMLVQHTFRTFRENQSNSRLGDQSTI